MESKIEQEFTGYINNIEFNDKNIFKTTEYIVQNMEKKFGEISNNFIQDFKDILEVLYEKSDIFSFSIFENETIKNINKTKNMTDLILTYENSDWKLEKINENLKQNKYLKKDNGKDEKIIIKKRRSRSRNIENEK